MCLLCVTLWKGSLRYINTFTRHTKHFQLLGHRQTASHLAPNTMCHTTEATFAGNMSMVAVAFAVVLQMTLPGAKCRVNLATHAEKAKDCKQSINRQLMLCTPTRYFFYLPQIHFNTYFRLPRESQQTWRSRRRHVVYLNLMYS